jgi:2'-5' RNA ligase
MKAPIPGDRALVVLLPDALASQVDSWRRLYDPNHMIVPPHITVAYPPLVPEEEWPSARPVIAKCLRQFAPFRIDLQEMGTSGGQPCYLWLKPEDNGTLARIHATLVHRFPRYAPVLPFDYMGHLTIGVFDSLERLREAQAAVRSEWKRCHFQVRHLVYMSPDAKVLWCECGRLALGESGARAQKTAGCEGGAPTV